MECSNGAVAAASQRMEHHPTVYPRGFAAARGLDCATNTCTPATRSALWFKEIYAGFCSAHFLQFSTGAADIAPLLAAEALELTTRGIAPSPVGKDHSLAPRGLGLWVLVGDREAANAAVGSRFLDALAHWACSQPDPNRPALVSCMRMSIATGAMRDAVLVAAAAGGASEVHKAAAAPWTVVLRWSDPGGLVHSCLQAHAATPVSANAALDAMQRSVCSLMGQYALMGSHTVAAALSPPPFTAHNAFVKAARDVDRKFESRLETPPSVTLSAAAMVPGAAPLEFTGIFVRVCEKKRGDEGITHTSAFHGVLLSFGSAKEAAARFANAADPALAVPLGVDEESMGLHLCAVQAQETALHADVSLFSHVGRAGEPIHPPYSHVLCQSAAIRPVDQALLTTWDVRPCDKSSLAPTAQALQEPWKLHFARASALYLSLGNGALPPTLPAQVSTRNSTQKRSGPSGEALDMLPRAPVVTDPQEERDEQMLRLSFHVDMRSRRTTIGDAYGYLFNCGAPKSLTTTMLSAIGKIGVRASLDDMFKLTGIALETSGTLTSDLVADNQRLKRLAAEALGALATWSVPAKRHATPSRDLLPVGAVEHVRRMLTSIGLKRGLEAALVPKMSDTSWGVVVDVILSAINHHKRPGTPPTSETTHLLVEAFADCRQPQHATDSGSERLTEWTRTVDSAVARAIAVAAMSNGLGDTPVFLMTTCTGAGSVAVQRVATDPLLSPSTFNAMIESPRSCVLLLQHLDAEALTCKLTATVPAKAMAV